MAQREVLTLNEAIPRIEVPQTGDSYLLPRDVSVVGNLSITGTVDGRDLSVDGAKLDAIEAGADVTDETNVKAALSGATIIAATLAGTDKILIQDTDDADNLKTVTAQSIADLAPAGGLSNIVEDVTPQLGGPLDVNGQEIQSAADVTFQLGDAAGANKLSVQDSASAEVFKVDSDGSIYPRVNQTGAGYITASNGSVDLQGDELVKIGDGSDSGERNNSTLNKSTLSFGSVDAAKVQVTTHNTDQAAPALTIKAADAYASATVNQDGGHLVFKQSANATGGGSDGEIRITDPADAVLYAWQSDGTIQTGATTGASAVAYKFGDPSFTTAGSKLIEITNNTDEAFSVDYGGVLHLENYSTGKALTLDPGGASRSLISTTGAFLALSANTNELVRIYADATYQPRLSFWANAQPSIEVLPQTSDAATVGFLVTGHDAYASASTNLDGGALNLTGGNGASASAGDADGGAVNLTGGAGYGTGDGGSVVITGGAANGSGVQGAITMSASAFHGTPETLVIACSDETTALTTGIKVTFYMPYAMTLTDIKASCVTAPTGASLITDVHLAGTTIMTTNKLEIEVGEFHTNDATTQPAITTSALTLDGKIEIEIDQVGSTIAGAGLKIYLIGTRT